MALRCQAWQDWPLTQVTFYRDGSALGPPGPRRELSIAAARRADSGHYHCSAVFRGPGPGRQETASPLVVTIQGESGGRGGRETDRLSAGGRVAVGLGSPFQPPGPRLPGSLTGRPECCQRCPPPGLFRLRAREEGGHAQCPRSLPRRVTPGGLSPASPPVPPELFPAPLLRAAPSAQPREGGPLTLSCQTKLSPQRSAARLLFSFYKDGRAVRGRGASPELQVPAASAGHSGSYWCEAATEDGQVWKHSPKLEVRVQGEWARQFACETGWGGVSRFTRDSGAWSPGRRDPPLDLGDPAQTREGQPRSCCPQACALVGSSAHAGQGVLVQAQPWSPPKEAAPDPKRTQTSWPGQGGAQRLGRERKTAGGTQEGLILKGRCLGACREPPPPTAQHEEVRDRHTPCAGSTPVRPRGRAAGLDSGQEGPEGLHGSAALGPRQEAEGGARARLPWAQAPVFPSPPRSL